MSPKLSTYVSRSAFNVKFVLLACIAVLCTTSCSWWNSIEAEGERSEKSYSVSSFVDVEFSSAAEIRLLQGSDRSVTIDTYASIHEAINVRVKGNTLKIDFDRDTDFNRSDLIITIVVPHLEELEADGSATILLSEFENASAMSFEISGSGDISMMSLNETLNAPSISFEINGSGDVDVNVDTEQLDAEISGSGDIDVSGTATEQNIEISGSGDFRGFECQGVRGDVVVSGSGYCEIAVTERLVVKISGSGEVVYDHDPELSFDVAGSGSVRRR